MKIKSLKQFKMMLTPPPDKSITIRAAILGAIADGKTTVINPLMCGDTVSTFNCVSNFADLSMDGGNIIVRRKKFCDCVMDAGNSATTARLLMGVASGRNNVVKFVGDRSLCSRNMRSTVQPLVKMGAQIEGERCPLTVKGGNLNGIDFVPSSPSAQVKSAVLLAGINAEGVTTVTETVQTRTHTEDMLKNFGANIVAVNSVVKVSRSELKGQDVYVRGDISSAAYPLVLGLLKGFCRTTNVCNKRRAIIDFFTRIGGDVTEIKKGEVSDIITQKSELKPFQISGGEATALIDELPLLACLAATIEGRNVIKDAAALRNKECDRIAVTAKNLSAIGVSVTETKDGLIIDGKSDVNYSGAIQTKGDHRIAMSFAVLLAAKGGGYIDDDKCVEISYPSFWELFL